VRSSSRSKEIPIPLRTHEPSWLEFPRTSLRTPPTHPLTRPSPADEGAGAGRVRGNLCAFDAARAEKMRLIVGMNAPIEGRPALIPPPPLGVSPSGHSRYRLSARIHTRPR
jgi:hypothetical protein